MRGGATDASGHWQFLCMIGAAIISGTFAVIILSAGVRRSPNRYLGAFLLLIMANQAIEAYRILHPGAPVDTTLRQLAAIAAAADPFFLYYFASVFPHRNRLHHPALVGIVLAMSAGLMLWAPFVSLQWPLDPPSALYDFLLGTFTAVVYVTVLLRFVFALRDPQSPRSQHLLVVALAVAGLPATGRVSAVFTNRLILGEFPFLPRPFFSGVAAFVPLFCCAAIAALAFRWRTRHPEAARTLNISSLSAAALAASHYVAYFYDDLTNLGVAPRLSFSVDFLASAWVPVRWILFGALVSMAIVRDQLLDMGQSARRWAARILLGELAAFLGATLLAVAHAAAGEGFRLGPVDFVTVLLLVAITQSSDSVIDQAARRLYRVPSPGNRAAAEDFYRSAVVQALEEGRDVEHDPGVKRLEQELSLDAETATWVRRAAVSNVHGPLRPGVWLQGRYRVDRLLARGGFGRTFLAHDRVLDRKVVVKEVLDGDGTGVDKGLEEARIAGSLQHANVLVVHDVIRGSGTVLLVEEYLEGGSLQDRLEREGPLPWETASSLVLEVLAGLEAVHRRGIIHRDIKPSNILFDAQGRAKIADFGTARVRRSATFEAAHAPTFAGTLEYMSPEQREGRPIAAASDLYQVGKLFLAVVRRPVPGPLQKVVNRALRASPRQRWQSASEFRRILEAVRSGPNGGPQPRNTRRLRPTPTTSPEPRGTRSPF